MTRRNTMDQRLSDELKVHTKKLQTFLALSAHSRNVELFVNSLSVFQDSAIDTWAKHNKKRRLIKKKGRMK